MSAGKQQPRYPLIFQHIPKTAGVSVRSVMSCNFHLSEILHVPDRHWTDAVFAADAVQKYRFVHGHIHYEFLKEHVDAASIVTFLRDPVERVLSLYFFLRKQSPESQSDPGARFAVEQAQLLPLDEFVTHTDRVIRAMVCNYQLNVLLSARQTNQPSHTWVAYALENLEKYQLVGIADADLMPASIQAMSRMFGWSATIEPPRVNHTIRSSSKSELERVREVIASQNELEIELYRQVRAGFLTKFATRDEATTHDRTILSARRKQYATGLTSPITMEDPLRCWGWHDRETNPNQDKYWRCAAGLRAGIELRVPIGARLIVFFELMSAHPRISIDQTVIEARGRPIPSNLIFADNRWVIGALVQPGDIDDDGIVSLQIVCKENEEGHGGDVETLDSRYVTFALERINIVIEKYTDLLNFELLRQSICEQGEARRDRMALRERALRAEGYASALKSELEKQSEQMQRLESARNRELLEAERHNAALKERAARAEANCEVLKKEVESQRATLDTSKQSRVAGRD